MTTNELQAEYKSLVATAQKLGYTFETPELFIDPVFGNKYGYYRHSKNQIVIHDDMVTNAPAKETLGTLTHELAHAIAEQNNTAAKGVWHGQAWKDVCVALGHSGERYHTGTYKKPAFKKQSRAELMQIKPKHPAARWERGTFNQWLTRGYHVIKGQKGTPAMWEFVADEYETDQDGKTSNYGRGYAVYFTPKQVEANV